MSKIEALFENACLIYLLHLVDVIVLLSFSFELVLIKKNKNLRIIQLEAKKI